MGKDEARQLWGIPQGPTGLEHCVEGGLVPLMECLVSHDLRMSTQFTSSWKERRVTMGGISFEVNEEVIA